MSEILVSRIVKEAQIPQRQHHDDGGLDLFAAENVSLLPMGRLRVRTGVRVALPLGTAGLVVPRSGISLKYGVTVVNSPGTIDKGYHGEILVSLVNLGKESYTVKEGDRIAQLLVIKVEKYKITEIDSVANLSSTRGSDGFGSTGT